MTQHPMTTTAGPSAAPRTTMNQLIRFAVVGVASTVLYTVLFAVLDMYLNHYVANVLALILSTVANTWVNQRFTFDAAGHSGGRRAQVQALVIALATLVITTAALSFEHAHWPQATTLWDTVTVTVGNALATVIKFVVLKTVLAPQQDEKNTH